MRDGHARTIWAPARADSDAPSPFCTAGWNASRLVPGLRSGAALAALLSGVGALAVTNPAAAGVLLHALLWPILGFGVALRTAALCLSRAAPEPAPAADQELPTYTVLAPLYRERHVAAQLIGALQQLDYPPEKLQILLVLESEDRETWAALNALGLSAPFEIFVAAPGAPRTKPRACNEALPHARGEFLVIYDAEDRPDPGQLREAGARFLADPRLSCLQAPLRIDRARCFLQRQFALEYAAQFEVMLPALHRFGAPFPLGGSSNHFRTAVLRRLGGWDAHNVTEDADLAFRLAAAGHATGLLRSPTWELAPRTLRAWRRQRSRWLKGHLQTWCVHLARPRAGGWRRFVALQATLGLGLISAFGHAPLLAMLLLAGAGAVWGGGEPPLRDLGLAALGWGASAAVMARGARRAGSRLRWRDALGAPFYWPLHTLAAVCALAQWFRNPFHWEKTEHRPIR